MGGAELRRIETLVGVVREPVRIDHEIGLGYEYRPVRIRRRADHGQKHGPRDVTAVERT